MIETTNIDTTQNEGRGNFIPKGLLPGNHKCIIHSIILEENIYSKVKNADGSIRKEWNIKLNLEGPALPNFEGFDKNWNDKSKGKYLGQHAFVRGTEYGLYDGVTTNGYPVDRNKDLGVWIKIFCEELGILPWLNAQTNKHDTWDLLYAQLKIDKPFAGKVVNFCLAGREYVNKKGYKAFDLFIPRKTDLGRGFSLNEELVQKFIESVHMKISKPKTVESFGNDTTPTTKIQTTNIITTETDPATVGAEVHKNVAEVVNTLSATPYTDDLFGTGNQDFLNQKDDKLLGNPIVVASEAALTGSDLPFSLD